MKKTFLIGISLSLILCSGCAGVSIPVGSLLPLLLIEENTVKPEQKPPLDKNNQITLDDLRLMDEDLDIFDLPDIEMLSTAYMEYAVAQEIRIK